MRRSQHFAGQPDMDFPPRPSLPAVWKPLLGEEVGRRAAACAASSATATSI